MWNNTRLLNLFANTLFLLGALIVFQLVAIAIINSPWLPVRSLQVQGELAHITQAQIRGALTGRPMGNFFSADLGLIRERLESLPWVRAVEVRRGWPDRLEVTIEEHRAFARWSDTHLVNTYGEVFEGTLPRGLPIPLPRFAGPAGAALELTHRFHQFREILRPLELEPTHLPLSPRYAWELRLSDGLVVELGRDQGRSSTNDRLERFVAAYPRTLATLNRKLSYVDLRYPNGFALRVPELANEAPAKAVAPRAKRV